MSNESGSGPLNIVIYDDGYSLSNSYGDARYNLNGNPTFKIGRIDNLPDRLPITDNRRLTEESHLKELQQQIDKYVAQAIKKALRPGGTLHGHSDRNLGGFARDCAARFAGSTMLPFGGFPHPARKIAITISGLEQWDNGIVSGATVTVDVIQKGKVIHSEVFSGKSTAEFSREVTVSASLDDIVTVHNRPDLPNLKVRAKFI